MHLLKRSTKEKHPNLEQLLSEFNRSLTLIVDKQLLINNIIAKIKQICPILEVHILLLDPDTEKYKFQTPVSGKIAYNLHTKDRLIQWLSVNETYLHLSEHPDILSYLSGEEQQLLKELEIELVYPLKLMNQISGTFLLGKKKDLSRYTPQETTLLSLLISQATFAIEHAALYEQQSERLKKMYRTDRLATLGELAAGAAHEIRNPLTTIRSSIQYLSKDFTEDPVKSEMFTEVIGEVERINKIVQGLLSFARPSELNISDVNIEQLINQTLLLANSQLHKQQIGVEFEYFTDNTTVSGDADQLKQVFLNIILNAVEAMSSNDKLKPRTLIISIEKGATIDPHTRHLIISLEDTGNGIKEAEIEKVFHPFFTTKEEGTGLGLAICYGIINRHQGEITIESIPGEGTRIHIKLPQRI